MFIGDNDVLVNPTDFKYLKSVLPDNITYKEIKDYNHLDYMWAKDANKFVNNDILSFFEENDI